MTPSVLVIDDDPRICRLIAMGFERAGYRVFEASNGLAGVKLFNIHHPEVVVTDILMPVMEGIATIMEMRKSAHETKIIAISGGGRLVGREFLKWARHLGADEVMAKPFRVSALVARAGELTAAADPTESAPAPMAEPLEYRLDRRHGRLAA